MSEAEPGVDAPVLRRVQRHPRMEVPAELDGYRIVGFVGGGGMGDVYEAYDTRLDRPVAIKFIRVPPERRNAADPSLVEGRSAARVQHPNVCVIHRVAEWRDCAYIVSEFVDGQSLASLDLPLSEDEVLQIGLGIARGLAAAHRQGVLHRDIKPANVLRAQSGEIKLVDFGIAELAPEVGAVEHVLDGSGAPEHGRASAMPEGRGDGAAVLRIDTFSMLGLSERTVIGTPDYVAPELWRGEPACRQSDVYALGVLLYELCIGETPYASTPLDELPHVSQAEEVSLAHADSSIDARLAGVIDRCLRIHLDDRYASAEEVRDSLEGLVPTKVQGNIPEGNPYRGLRPFEAEHSALLFGRNRETRAIVDRLRSDPLVIVAGDSGVGKSSICRAGVLPFVELGAFEDGRRWRVLSLLPGRRPLVALSQALDAAAKSIATATGVMSAHRRDDALGPWLSRVLGKSHGLAILIDQMEELVTLAGRDEAEAFARAIDELLLFTAVTSPPLAIRVMATARSDFLAAIATLPHMGDRLGRALYVLRPMDEKGIREAIIGPAAAHGFSYESEAMIQVLVDSTKDTTEGLPLLQFALTELWGQRNVDKRMIPVAGLSTIGGVSGALARYADGVLAQMLAPVQKRARGVLLGLVTSNGTRARRTAEELGIDGLEAKLALESLVNARLLLVKESEGGTVYEVAHEALLSGWATLRSWLDDSEHIRSARERVAQAASEWERLGRGAGALWGKTQLEDIAKVDLGELPSRDGAFLHASRKSERKRRRQIRLLVFGGPLIVALVVALFVIRERREVARRLDLQVRDGMDRLTKARMLGRTLEAERQRTFALFRSGELERAEDAWATLLEAEHGLDRHYRDASQNFEAALLMDRGRTDAKRALAEVLYERALRAEREENLSEKEEALKRLRLFDEGEHFWSQWNAPGTVTVETSPPGASIVLEQYESDVRGRMKPVKIADWERSPMTAPATLRPGSYRLIITLEGYGVTRYPVLVTRGERVDVAVRLVREAEVPDGFIYVPAGKGFVGMRGSEELRKWSVAMPKQIIQTPGFFIRKTETTYAEWLEYLDTLPEAERKERMPSVGGTGRHGALRLIRLGPGRWQFSFRFNKHLYIADNKGHITYQGRDRRAKQSWLRFPVTGISFFDAKAYADYLRKRYSPLLRARLCDEYEWERAARGADDRLFPHGNHLDRDDINFDETYGKDPRAFGPDEVGSHPSSVSPYGVYDMAGNVWEWVMDEQRTGAMHGGSYYDSYSANYAANRDTPELNFRDFLLGLRICADLP